MEVVDQEGKQAACQSRSQHSHVAPVIPGGDPHIEQGHGNGHAGGQTIHTVGEVDGIHGTDHNKGGKDHVDHPGQCQFHIEEGDVQVGGQITDLPQPDGEHHSGSQLQQELLPGGQTLVGLMAQLLHIVNEADDAKHQRKEEHHDMGTVPGFQILGTGHQDRDNNTQNKHQSAHAGSALFAHVPGRTVLPDHLSGFQTAQHGHQHKARNGRRAKGHDKAENICHIDPSRFLSFL